MVDQPEACLSPVASRRTESNPSAGSKAFPRIQREQLHGEKAEHPNHVWTWDFNHDRTLEGRPVKLLSLVVTTQPLGHIEFKGKEQPVALWALRTGHVA